MAPEDARGHPFDLIHTIPVHYALDAQKGVRDPIGMGERPRAPVPGSVPDETTSAAK